MPNQELLRKSRGKMDSLCIFIIVLLVIVVGLAYLLPFLTYNKEPIEVPVIIERFHVEVPISEVVYTASTLPRSEFSALSLDLPEDFLRSHDALDPNEAILLSKEGLKGSQSSEKPSSLVVETTELQLPEFTQQSLEGLYGSADLRSNMTSSSGSKGSIGVDVTLEVQDTPSTRVYHGYGEDEYTTV